MQISLTQNQIHHFQSRFFQNINDTAKNDYEKASYYYDLYKMVGAEGFASFLTQYFSYTPEQIQKAETRSKAREMFSSCRLWMRVGGRKGIQKLVSITDEEKRDHIVKRISEPKGVVNYTPADLDRMIESDGSLDSSSVTFFTSHMDWNSSKNGNGRSRSRSRNRSEQPAHRILQKLEKTISQALSNQPKRKRSRNRSRQTANV